MAARKPRKTRVDSTAGAVDVLAKASAPLHPPPTVPLDPADVPFFANVIDEFARSEWTAHQLELAAMLARTMADFVREQTLLRTEGATSLSERGTPVVNPRKTVVQMHAGTILSMRRSLSLHARATGGDSRDIGKRRAMTKEIEDGVPEDDGLLARPN
ncbi:terminase small subunit [Stappia sp. 22II-S9-Z10]|nr:terminase small subunit [Stappia sp. 22II-S9-Z10]